jgi:hypothetical protein
MPTTPPTRFAPVPDLPELGRVMSPTIEVGERVIDATITDAKGVEIRLTFRPYQAMRLTTVDCYREPDELPHRPEVAYWTSASEWIDELKASLAVVDRTADFMDRAVHFVVPAGDDVLEVVAWQVEISRSGMDAVTLPR